MKIKTLSLLAASFSFAAIALAGPVGPPSGPPFVPDNVILNQSTAQPNKTFNVSSATVTGLITSTITANRILIGGVAVSTSITSGTSVYPATGTIVASKGVSATTITVSGLLNGSSITITALFSGATIHGSSAVITGTITGANLTGTNTGDVSIGIGRGLSLVGQTISLAAASTVSTGSLSAQDFNTFNGKLDPDGDGSALTGMTKSQVGLGNVANVDQTDADNLTSGTVGTARLGSGTASSARYLRGDSSWQLLNSTTVGLGNVTNDKQVRVADYTQKGAILVGISTGVFAVFPPGTDGFILQSNSASSYGYSWVISPKSFTIYPATATAAFPYGFSATTATFTGAITGASASFSGTVHASTVTVSSLTATGQVTGSNLSGTNTGDVTIGSSNGLGLAGQVLSMSTSSANQTGALTSTDWSAFNSKSAAFTASSPIIFSGAIVSIDKSSATLLGPSPTTSVISEGSNLYYTTARSTTAIIGQSPMSNVNGEIRIDKSSATLLGPSPTTTSIPEGSNLYYTAARSTTAITATLPLSNTNGVIAIDKSSATLLGPSPTTTVISEGSNLYYTTARTTTAITATSPLSNTNGVLALSSVLPSGATNYLQNTTSLQSGATIYLGTGTIQNLTVSTITIGNQLQHVNSIVNVKDVAYGAKGDGSTNDTTAVQAAINAVSTNGGGKVFFPKGTYILSPLTIPDYTELVGQGAKSTILSFAIAASTALQCASSTDVKVRGLKLFNNSAWNTSRAIYGGTIREFAFDDYEVEGFYDGLIFDEPVNCVIGQGRWVGLSVASGTCITMGSLAAGLSATADDINNAYCSTYSTGVYVQAGNTNRIKSIFETTQKPIVTNTHAGTNGRTFVDGTHFEGNASNAILITALGNSEVFASGLVAYEGAYISDWGPRISGKVTIFTNDQIITSTATAIQVGTTLQATVGNIALQNSKAVTFVNPQGNAFLDALSVDTSSFTTLNVNSQPFRVQNSSVTTVTTSAGIGTNGSAVALTANPAGYLYFIIGGAKKQIPYYNTNP